MPRIFDNIEEKLLPTLSEAMGLSKRSDFCVGYFNLRGWRQIDSFVEKWPGGDGNCCRLLVGMQTLPAEDLRAALSLATTPARMDNATALRLKKALAEEFRNQLCIGAPTEDDERGLRRLAAQIKAQKVVVKLFVKHPLHAKLYLLFRPDPKPIIDEIDRVLAKHYGFTDEELDFVINYDIKYRMGLSAGQADRDGGEGDSTDGQ